MRFVWKRLSPEDVDRLVKKYNLEPLERQIIELRCKGAPLYIVANQVGYSVRSIERHSEKILEKILNEF